MRAVVMAGGEGTRLRPLTSNQPKPMVPICGKPCIEHIVELVHRYGIDDVVVTLAFMPQVIRSYLGDGSALGVRIQYCGRGAAARHRGLGAQRAASTSTRRSSSSPATLSATSTSPRSSSSTASAARSRHSALKSVENPLEFGVVITDEQGRIERFLEKPSWGQVFSDTINTGVYVIEPELLERIPEGEPYDFSKQLFPELLAEGAPLYGFVVPERRYWKDIGTIEQFREANQDVLDGLVGVNVPGVRLKGNIWLGEGVDAPVRRRDRGACLPGRVHDRRGRRERRAVRRARRQRDRQGRRLGAALGDRRRHAHRLVGHRVEGATVGRNCDLRARVRVDEGAAIGDECVVGEEALIGPEVRVYPYKTIEAGAQIRREPRLGVARRTLALLARRRRRHRSTSTSRPRQPCGSGWRSGRSSSAERRIVAARDGHPASRMITRAMVSGLSSTGVNVADLRIAWPALVRHHVRIERLAGGVYVRVGHPDPESVEITFLASSGLLAGADERRGIERAYARQEYRRASVQALGRPSWPPDALERYADALVDRDRRGRGALAGLPDGRRLRRQPGLAGGAARDGLARRRGDRPERLLGQGQPASERQPAAGRGARGGGRS